MIPQEISREHILNAIDEIDREGIPSNRESTVWLLNYNGKHYPPKYVISIAGKYALGHVHSHELFSGGPRANNFLTSRGFLLVPKADALDHRHTKVLLKAVGISQHQDGVRINKEFHPIFNPHDNPSYVAKGQSRSISVSFNNKSFPAKYVYEGTKAERDLQRIQFSRELISEFKLVFPNATGFFSIKLGKDINNLIFLHDTKDAYEIERNLEEKVSKSRTDSREQRQLRLAEAQSKPDTVQVTSVAYIRNADVIVEVLERSNGVCEECGNDAPFLRRKDKTPYLEVHHRIPLSEGGFDSVENAIAVCPNCHRELHYG